MKKIFLHDMLTRKKNKKVIHHSNNESLDVSMNDFFLMEIHKDVMR